MRTSKYLVLLFALLVAGATSAKKQTPFTLPDSACSFQASNYLFCSAMGYVQIGTDTYSVSSTYTITNVYQWLSGGTPQSGDFSGGITFQDISQQGYPSASVDVTGTFSYDSVNNTHHLTVTSIGPWIPNGVTPPFKLTAFDFDVAIQLQGCNRGCHYYPEAENVAGETNP